MPLIQVKLMEEVFTPTQKKEFVSKLTNAVVPIGGENMRPVTWVSIEEVCSGEWSTRRSGHDYQSTSHLSRRQEIETSTPKEEA